MLFRLCFRYTDEPFTSYMPEALFNISRYLMHELLANHPKGWMGKKSLFVKLKWVNFIHMYIYRE
jgi:intraflagellar transport protein 122